MISIIVCSVNPEQNKSFQENIKQTIGVPYEILVHDNRKVNWGLCRTYNHYARMSKYDLLCFFHEDILFHTTDWGKIIIDFYRQKPDAGVVGFAGSTVKTQYINGWGSYRGTNRKNLVQYKKNGTPKNAVTNPDNLDFAPVAVLDGLALITTKKVWEKNTFDEKTFSRFHLYDLDFSLQVAQHYTNYVCYKIKIIHLSEGNYTKEWFRESEKFIRKWTHVLPFSITPYPQKFIRKCEEHDQYQMIKVDLHHNQDELSLLSILKKVNEVDSPLYKLRLAKYVSKAGWKKITQKSKQIKFITKGLYSHINTKREH